MSTVFKTRTLEFREELKERIQSATDPKLRLQELDRRIMEEKDSVVRVALEGARRRLASKKHDDVGSLFRLLELVEEAALLMMDEEKMPSFNRHHKDKDEWIGVSAEEGEHDLTGGADAK